MGPIIDIAGLACCFVGVMLMMRYTLPGHLSPINGKPLSESGHIEDGRRNLIGLGGFLLYGFGSALQIIAVILP